MLIWAGIFVAGGIASAIFMAAFSSFMEHSASMDACIGCHEMENNVYKEYKRTVHYSNRTGVRVICADCHIPRSMVGQIYAKFKAIPQLYSKITGKVDTPEKFDQHRLELAEGVWAEMEANGSRECKECHSYDAMDFHKQAEEASEVMQSAMEADMGCIECHKGVAHKLPEGY